MTQQQLQAVLQALAVKFNTTTEFLWLAMVKQAYVEAVISIIIMLLALSWIVFIGLAFRKIQAWVNNGDALSDRGLVSVPLTGSVIFAVLLFAGSFQTAVTGLMNPEYWALKNALEMVNK